MRLLLISLLFASVSGLASAKSPALTSLTLVDHHGLHDSVQSKERLGDYQKINWLRPQPYRKVVRTYAKDGRNRSYITTYYASGQPKQYLQALDGRALGTYYEWHLDGRPKLSARVVGGVADVEEGAAESYLFDGITEAWDESGNLSARIPYVEGELHGVASYFYPGEVVAESIPYVHGKREGVALTYRPDGTLRARSEYVQGQLHGSSQGFWTEEALAFDETWESGLLERADYFWSTGDLICSVRLGEGERVSFNEDGGYERIEYRSGAPEGAVKVYDERGTLLRCFHVSGEHKHGEETVYYPPSPFARNREEASSPKLQINWYRDQIQGVVRTWYPSGKLETQREMSRNQRNGLSLAWYEEGSLMLVEEYRDDQLIKGEYFLPGSSTPASRVVAGNGTATLFDQLGNPTTRISYLDGHPV